MKLKSGIDEIFTIKYLPLVASIELMLRKSTTAEMHEFDANPGTEDLVFFFNIVFE